MLQSIRCIAYWWGANSLNDMLAYQASIISEHRRCGGRGWLLYDSAFQQQFPDDACIDTASKEVIEVVNEASCTMLEKASDAEVSQFQCYTIRNLDNKLSTESDIEQ